jgi:hypothetical protein
MPPSIYPTGTTIYYPEKCWNGYTLFPAELHRNNGYGAVLIDMNGNVVNRWQGLDGFPNKMLSNGHIRHARPGRGGLGRQHSLEIR